MSEFDFYYKIEEEYRQGKYFSWPGSYYTKESAEKEIKLRKKDNCRVVLYKQNERINHYAS